MFTICNRALWLWQVCVGYRARGAQINENEPALSASFLQKIVSYLLFVLLAESTDQILKPISFASGLYQDRISDPPKESVVEGREHVGHTSLCF